MTHIPTPAASAPPVARGEISFFDGAAPPAPSKVTETAPSPATASRAPAQAPAPSPGKVAPPLAVPPTEDENLAKGDVVFF